MGRGGSPEPLSRAIPNLTPSFPTSFLHPNVGKRRKYKTSVRKKTLNPEFNEVGRGPVEAVPAAPGREDQRSASVRKRRSHLTSPA